MVKRLLSPTVRYWAKLGVDALAWVIGILSALIFRYEFDLSRINVAGAVTFCVVAALSQIIAGSIVARVWGVHSFGSFFEARSLIISTVFVAAVLAVLNVLFGVALGVPRSIGFIAFPITVLFMGITRYVKRLVIDRTLIPLKAQRVLIYGAGHLGANLTGRMLKDPASTYLPVGFIDDDTSKSKFRIQGLKVYGTVDDLASAVAQTQATAVIVSMRKVDTTLLRKVSTHADAVGLRVLVLPPLEDMLADPEAQVAGIRDLAVEDFIGRNPIQTDLSKVSSYVTGKRVLVTGAGGSIGSELCKQLATFGPAELVMLDRDESQLQGTQLAISGHGLLDSNEVVLSDIRDVEALDAIFKDRRPEVVFHAAALKHLPLLEQYPDEAWKTNVLGTLNVLNAAVAVGVETFVNISTDKAANPVSVLGHSKRVAERLTGFVAEETGLRYLSVRFGNVIGSRGSVLPAFTAQIAAGGPVTVTDPNVTRFFMTIPEACQLVIQAGAIGAPGEVLILDMGEPVKILDIAQRLIAMSGKKIEITFTGLRPGEKLHEELIGVDEISDRKIHPLISHTVIKPMHPDKLDQAQWNERRRNGGPESAVSGE